MLGGLKRGDTVVLHSGVIGKVVRVEDAEVGVEIATGVTVKVRKAMISEVAPAARRRRPTTPRPRAPSSSHDESCPLEGDPRRPGDGASACCSPCPTCCRPRCATACRASCRKNTLNLGLDLQGGSYLLYSVDTAALRNERLTNMAEDVRTTLRDKQIAFTDLAVDQRRDRRCGSPIRPR